MLKNFQVIELISSKTKASLTIYPDRLKFNKDTAPDLDYAAHVQLLMDPNGKAFAVRVCNKDDVNSVPFFTRSKESKPYPIVLRYSAAIKQIFTAMNWEGTDKYYVVGGQKFYEDKAIVFNLNDAEPHEITTRKGGDEDESDDE